MEPAPAPVREGPKKTYMSGRREKEKERVKTGQKEVKKELVVAIRNTEPRPGKPADGVVAIWKPPPKIHIEEFHGDPQLDRGAAGDGRDTTKPWKRRPNEGAYTGAPRPAYPKVFRPFGSNTRQRVVGDRSRMTHMHHLGYAKGIVESKPVPPLLSPQATLGQSGAASITSRIPALRSGPSHLLFSSR